VDPRLKISSPVRVVAKPKAEVDTKTKKHNFDGEYKYGEWDL